MRGLMYKKRLKHPPKLDLTKRQRVHIVLGAVLLVLVMAYGIYLAANSTELIVRRSVSHSKAN
jgi:hypothetical protein